MKGMKVGLITEETNKNVVLMSVGSKIQNSSFINSVDEVCLSPYKNSVARMTFVAKNNNSTKPRETADGTLRICFLPVGFSISVKYHNMSKGSERIDDTEHRLPVIGYRTGQNIDPKRTNKSVIVYL